MKAKQACPLQSGTEGRSDVHLVPLTTYSPRSPLRRLKRQGSRLGPHVHPEAPSAGSPGPPPLPRAPGARAPRLARGDRQAHTTTRSRSPGLREARAGSRLATPSSGYPVLVPPDPGPLPVTPIASPRSSRPRAASAFRRCYPRGLGGFPWRRRRGRSAGGRRARRRHRGTRVPSGPFPSRGLASQLQPRRRRYSMLTESLGSHKMGPGSGRRRLHGRRHFVRRGGARLCVMVEASDPPLGNPRR